MHTHLVFSLSFHTPIALSASVAWQSLLLALISIDGHLHSPLISRVDLRLSPFLSSPHNLHHHILFHLYCYIHGLRSCIAWGLKMLKRVKKYEPIAWLTPVWAWGVPCVKKREHTRLYDFVGIAFFSIGILKDMIVCWDSLSIIVFIKKW